MMDKRKGKKEREEQKEDVIKNRVQRKGEE